MLVPLRCSTRCWSQAKASSDTASAAIAAATQAPLAPAELMPGGGQLAALAD